jgi:hypothetical protein
MVNPWLILRRNDAGNFYYLFTEVEFTHPALQCKIFFIALGKWGCPHAKGLHLLQVTPDSPAIEQVA